MSQMLTCPGCQATLRVRDDMAGKKIKCPRCAELVPVPAGKAVTAKGRPAADEGFTEVKPLPASKVKSAPGSKGAVPTTRPCPSCGKSVSLAARTCRHCDAPLDEEDEKEAPRKKRSKFKACPRCGARGARRVMWTPWGSFYGPKLFTHVRCPDCGYAYNGSTGGSNLVPIILFLAVPTVGIVAVLMVIAYLFHRQGYF